MPEIKKYSSTYATKMAYVLSDILNIKQHGLISDISAITQEKESTTKNWLFNGRVPRDPKRITIADSLGISEEYLFNDSINVLDIRKPEIVKREGCYWIPVVEEKDLFRLKKAVVFPIKERIPLMLPSFGDLVALYGQKIYATKLKESNFSPYIESGATLICCETTTLEEYKFYLCYRNNKLTLKRLLIVDGEKKFLINAHGLEVIEPIGDEEIFLVIIAFSY